MAKVDFRTFGVLEELVEDGTGKASRRIMEIFYGYMKGHGFEEDCDIFNSMESGMSILLKPRQMFMVTYDNKRVPIIRDLSPIAKINIEDSKKHESFHIIVFNQRLANIVLEHRDFIEKELFGNNKVKIVDYEKKISQFFKEDGSGKQTEEVLKAFVQHCQKLGKLSNDMRIKTIGERCVLFSCSKSEAEESKKQVGIACDNVFSYNGQFPVMRLACSEAESFITKNRASQTFTIFVKDSIICPEILSFKTDNIDILPSPYITLVE